MWVVVLGKNRRFKKVLGSQVLIESSTGRKFFPVVQHLWLGNLPFSDVVKLQQAGEKYLPKELMGEEIGFLAKTLLPPSN